MILYHRTTAANAASILSGGFRDGTGKYMTDREFSGVWLSDIPLDDGTAAHDTVLRVTMDIPESELAQWEWVEAAKSYREWLVPASIVNSRGIITLMDNDELP